MQTSHGCIALNPDVTDESLGQTICVTGYTTTVRPLTTYTNGIKAKLVREAGLDGSHMADYELDHIIPLAVGGHPRKLSNLQLQPWHGEDGATEKDGLERQLQRMVCDGQLALADAQFCIAEDWHACAAEITGGCVVTGGNVITQSEPSAAVVPPQQDCVIKGNISKNGKIYHVPGSSSYDKTQIAEARGERWFCTQEEARTAGWRPPLR